AGESPSRCQHGRRRGTANGRRTSVVSSGTPRPARAVPRPPHALIPPPGAFPFARDTGGRAWGDQRSRGNFRDAGGQLSSGVVWGAARGTSATITESIKSIHQHRYA